MAAAVLAQTQRPIRGQQPGAMRSPRSDDGASSHRLGYFDKYPARAIPGKVADDDGERYTPTAPASLNGHAPPPRRTRVQRSGSAAPYLHIQTEPAKYEWPSKSDHTVTPSRSSSPDSPSPKPSKPSSLSSKSRARNSVASTIPELRYSASTLDRASSPPPQTPVGAYHPLFSGDNVVVAAPVHGVEMMDAFVDGMNGSLAEHSSSDGNDYRISSRSRRHGAKKHLSSLEKRHPGLHPHSTPPLPKPPQGIKLGTPSRDVLDATVMLDESNDEPTVLRPQRSARPRVRSSTNAEVPSSPGRSPTDPIIRKGRSSSQLRKPRSSTTSQDPLISSNPTIDQIINKNMAVKGDGRAIPKYNRKSMAPSISEIIRTHAPEHAKPMLGSRSVRNGASPVLPTSLEETEQDDDPAGRSSVDSITHEVQSSLQKAQPSPLHHARSFPNRPTGGTASAPPTTYGGFRSLRVSESEQDGPLETPKYARSVYSASSHGFDNPSSFFSSVFFSPPPADSAMAIAQYLRSPRLTRLLTLRKPPHRGLTVSLADVGNPNGRPVMVFLGLGCVRYLIALYDEMAEALGLRLIAVDRWGMGRTSEVPQEQRGLKEWAAVCEEVMDTLGIKSCGILAHSAGAPYALAFALRVSHRITGSIHLLAPWVGGGIDAAGYKWLKYVPNSMIKAAQNAEWKVHGWKLGKPPTIVYEGIGFDPSKAPVSANVTLLDSMSTGYMPLTAEALRDIEITPPPTTQSANQSAQSSMSRNGGQDEVKLMVPRPSNGGIPRTSMGGWSDYDDLADFEGKFGSQTTLPCAPPVPPLPSKAQNMPITKRKTSNRFFGKLKAPALPSNSSPVANSTPVDSSIQIKNLQKIRVLPSISSLKGKLTGQRSNSGPHKPSTPMLEANLDSFGTGLGIDVVDFKAPPGEKANGIEAWASACSTDASGIQLPDSRPTSPMGMSVDSHTFPRARRSVSLTASVAPTLRSLPAPLTPVQRAKSSPVTPRPLSGDSMSMSGSPQINFTTPPRAVATTNAPTSSVATALLRASHKEAQKGLANDLLSILERDAKPWGFSYADVRQKVKVWYGDKDEKISESGIRWMERVMKDCEVKICKGKDHSLMTCAAVVVEALESLQADSRWS